jgi:hypothetical protein
MIHTYSDLEASIQDSSDNLCSNFGELKPICEHVMTSTQNTRYMNVYMALLKNDPTFIDNDLREQSTDTCDGCKNAIQSSKDFWINSLVRMKIYFFEIKILIFFLGISSKCFTSNM